LEGLEEEKSFYVQEIFLEVAIFSAQTKHGLVVRSDEATIALISEVRIVGSTYRVIGPDGAMQAIGACTNASKTFS
jgi:hypothetical protein